MPPSAGAGGLWEGHRVEEVATPSAFERDPELVWRFYNLAAGPTCGPSGPTPATSPWPRWRSAGAANDFTLVTQNVDGLHRAAGSRHVLELHGTLARVRCTGCGKIEDRPGETLAALPRCRACGATAAAGHGLVPRDAAARGLGEAAEAAAQTCDCFLVVGTSAVVYPAAGLVQIARGRGATSSRST